MPSPEISVIIPAFNGERFIADAIESVLSQTLGNLQIIVIDDGSTDNTRNICLNYGEKITYVYQPNAGVAAARNKGMGLALGKYLSFLDCDDIMIPYKLEVQKAFMDKADRTLGFSFTEFSLLGNDKVIDQSHSRNYFNVFLENNALNYDRIFPQRRKLRELGLPCPKEYLDQHIYSGNVSRQLIRGNFINTSTVMLRRECMDYFNPNLQHYEDYELWSRLSKKYEAGYLDIPTVFFRRHGESLSSDRNLERRLRSYLGALEMAWYQDQIFYGQYRKEIDRALSRKAYSLGKYYLSNRNYAEAHRYFRRSLTNRKIQKGTYVYFIYSYIRTRCG